MLHVELIGTQNPNEMSTPRLCTRDSTIEAVSEKRDTPDSKVSGRDEFFRLMTRYAPAIGLMPASLLAGYAVGYALDHVFSTTILRYVFLILGMVSCIIQLIRMLGRDAS